MNASDLTDRDREEILRLLLLELEEKKPLQELLAFPLESVNLFRRVMLEGGLVLASGLKAGANGVMLFQGTPRLTPKGRRRLAELNARRAAGKTADDLEVSDEVDDDDDDDE